MRATSPPGSTIAARLVAVQATIEQFCWNGVTGTTVTLSGCMGDSRERGEAPHMVKPAVLRESLQRGLRPRAEMLDHFGGRERAEPRAVAVILPARKPGQEAGREQVARAGRVDELADRRGRAPPRCSRARRPRSPSRCASPRRASRRCAAPRCAVSKSDGLVQALQFALVGEDEIDRAGAHQVEEFVAIALDAERVRQRQRDLAVRRRARSRPPCGTLPSPAAGPTDSLPDR